MCPPGVDQTTRTWQRWYLIAPELLQFHPVETDQQTYSSDPKVSLFNPKIDSVVWGKLARPVIASATIEPQHKCSGTPKNSERLSFLEKLSNELLDMIFEHLATEKKNMVALGLSSQFLWQVVLHRIHAGYIKSAAPWAGKMIAFQGSYSTDLPEAFTENGLAESITGKSWFGNMCAARRFFWAHSEGSPVTPYVDEKDWLEAARSHRLSSAIPETCWWTIEEELGCSYLFPKDQEWLLRNLTTREIISLGVLLGSKARKTRSGRLNAVRLGEALLIKSMYHPRIVIS
jgi:hypothetical protein